MTLMEIYDFIKFVGNKDFNGNFYTPAQFNSSIQVANLDYFKSRHGLPEEYQPGQPIPRVHPEVTQKIIDDLREFKEHVIDQVVSTGYFDIPADYIHYDDISYNYTRNIDGTPTALPRPVEMLTERKLSDRMGNYIKRPTTKNPVGVIRADDTNQRIYIFPDTINAVDFHYYRMPVKPVFDYTIVSDELVYAPGTSTEFEWHENTHMDLIRILFSYLGINLRSQEIVQYAEMQKAKGI